jgi:hypothetical protein
MTGTWERAHALNVTVPLGTILPFLTLACVTEIDILRAFMSLRVREGCRKNRAPLTFIA